MVETLRSGSCARLFERFIEVNEDAAPLTPCHFASSPTYSAFTMYGVCPDPAVPPISLFTHSWLTQPYHGCSTVKHVKAHICTGSSLGKNHAPVPLTSVDEAPTLTCLYTVSPVQRAAAFPPLKHGCQASFHLAAEWSGSWLQRSPERGTLMAAFCASLSVGSIWARKHVILTERGGDKK